MATTLAHAQAIDVTPPSDFAAALVARLRTTADPSTFITVVDAPRACAATTTRSFDISVQLGASHVVEICARSAQRAATRTLGPFASLDATVVEQVATAVEAMAEALQPPAAISASDERANTSHDAGSAQLAETALQREPPATAPLANATSRAPGPAPSASIAPTQASPTPTPEDVPSPGYLAEPSYQPTLWPGDTLAHAFRVGLQHDLGPHWLRLGVGLSATLPFDVENDNVGCTFTAFAADALPTVSVALTPQLDLEAALGARAQLLLLRPQANDSNADAFGSSYQLKIEGHMEAGTRVRIAARAWIVLRLAWTMTLAPARFVFVRGSGAVTVLDQSTPRTAMIVGAQLAL